MRFGRNRSVPLALVIDDDPFIRRLARAALEKIGLTVEEADDGSSGLKAIEALAPNIVLLDVMMPDPDGFAVCRAVRKLPGGQLLPVLMLTAMDNMTSIDQAYQAGATDFISKPINWTILGHRVLYMLGVNRLLVSLARNEQELSDAQRIAGLGSWTWFAQDKRTTWSKEMLRMVGVDCGDNVEAGHLLAQRAHPDDRERVARIIGNAQQCGHAYSVDFRLVQADGKELFVHAHAEPGMDNAGALVAMHGTLQDITERKRTESELTHSKEKLRQVLAHQNRIREDERGSIARELHDELGSYLSGIKSYFSFALYRAAQAGETPDAQLLETSSLVDNAISTMRRVITDLRPGVLDHLGIWTALEWQAGQVAQQSGLSCRLEIDASAAQRDIDTERSTALFRIVQESLTNCVRHAAASQVVIQARYADNCIFLTVRDDGKGIAPNSIAGGQSWGIEGMRERARDFGGDFRISGAPGIGTTVHLRLPLEQTDVT